MKQLKKFEFKAAADRSVYDWGKWLDGNIYQLTEGEDFVCKVNTIITLIRNQAKKCGKAVQINKLETAEGQPVQIVIKAGAEGSDVPPPKNVADE